jgi:hypothetical protein
MTRSRLPSDSLARQENRRFDQMILDRLPKHGRSRRVTGSRSFVLAMAPQPERSRSLPRLSQLRVSAPFTFGLRGPADLVALDAALLARRSCICDAETTGGGGGGCQLW